MKAAVFLVLAGCFAYEPLPPERAAPKLRKISEAKILDMNVNLYKQTGLCPGTEGKLYVDGHVQWPGMEPVHRNLGSDVDSFNPASFRISGPLVQANEQAHVLPSADVLASVETGFEVDVVYTPEPRWKFHYAFPPEYSCWSGWGERGDDGGPGNQGGGGGGGDVGQPGGPGNPGDPGIEGKPGRRIQAVVTEVSTKYYPKLYAVIANGTFFLAPPDRELIFDVSGGNGGQGGTGGPGGPGGAQETVDQKRYDNGQETTVRVGRGSGGQGGTGGQGGQGGRGGDGGTVEVTYDAAFPELRNYIRVAFGPGQGGAAGEAGPGGDGGASDAEENASPGQPGGTMGPGQPGRNGRNGSGSVRPGNVTNQFRNLRGVTPLAGGGRRR